MKVTIESLGNGWTVSQDDGENYSSAIGFTYDADADQQQEIEKFAQLLQYLNESIGPTTSRYDKARIYVKLAPGDKHED